MCRYVRMRKRPKILTIKSDRRGKSSGRSKIGNRNSLQRKTKSTHYKAEFVCFVFDSIEDSSARAKSLGRIQNAERSLCCGAQVHFGPQEKPYEEAIGMCSERSSLFRVSEDALIAFRRAAIPNERVSSGCFEAGRRAGKARQAERGDRSRIG